MLTHLFSFENHDLDWKCLSHEHALLKLFSKKKRTCVQIWCSLIFTLKMTSFEFDPVDKVVDLFEIPNLDYFLTRIGYESKGKIQSEISAANYFVGQIFQISIKLDFDHLHDLGMSRTQLESCRSRRNIQNSYKTSLHSRAYVKVINFRSGTIRTSADE